VPNIHPDCSYETNVCDIPRSCDVRRDLLDKQLWDASVCFLMQDGHGHGQLVGLCLLGEEDSSQMRVMVEMFGDARNVC